MTKSKWIINILCIVVILTNLSQLPVFVEAGITGYVSYACWGALAALFFLAQGKISYKMLKIVFMTMGIFVVLCVLTLVTGRNYLDTSIFNAFIMSVGILFISHLIPRNAIDFDGTDFDKLYYSYIFSATVVAIFVYVTYFGIGFDFNFGIYEYASKNSTSQIVITAIVLATFCFKHNRTILNILSLMCVAFNMVLLFAMRSRASIIGLVVLIIMVLANRKINKWVRGLTLLVTIGFVLVVLLDPEMYDLIVEQILFASRDSSDINDLSSGRLEQWTQFPALFAEYPFFGRGPKYIESFPLATLASHGIIIGGIMLCFAIYPAVYSFRYRRESRHYYILLVLSLVYLLNGIFEELSPFGPGVKCYFIWFLFGILMSAQGKIKMEKKEKEALPYESK